MGKQIDHNSFWVIKQNPITKIGVFPYLGRQISPELEPNKIYQVLRPESELFTEEALASFNALPITIGHALLGPREEGLTPAEEKGIDGTTGASAERKDDKVVNDIKLFSERIKDEVNHGKKELSAGYFCDFVPESGTWNGRHYDFVQKNIRGNHIALVDKGRSGHDVRVMDSAEGVATRQFVCDTMELGKFEPAQDENDKHDPKTGQFAKKGSGTSESKEEDKNSDTEKEKARAEKQEARQKRLLSAIETLKENEEVVVEDLRDDLKQYGVTNDIALKWGSNDAKGKGAGIKHILENHGKESFVGIANSVVNGQIKEYHKQGQRLILEHDGYKAILSLNDNGKKKVWLLTGYKIDPDHKNPRSTQKKAQDEISEISAQSDPTQYGPTFWRPALVACAIDSLTDFFDKSKGTQKLSSKNHGNSGLDAATGKEMTMEQLKKAIEEIKALFANPEEGDKDAKLAEILSGLKDEPAADDKCATDEDVDKRKLIDEIGGILNGKVDDEIIRSVLKKAEEIAYNDSTAETADDEEETEEVKEESKEKEDKKVASLDEMEKALLARLSRKAELVNQLTPIIGAFDSAMMTEKEVAAYACKKLNLSAAMDEAPAVVKGYLAGRAKNDVRVTFGAKAKTAAQDEQILNEFKEGK